MKYTVKQILEADYGCEERPEGSAVMALLRLCDENGLEVSMEVPDADLTSADINEGERIFFDRNKKIHKEQ